MRMTLWDETKSVPVSREMVWAAYKKVKSKWGQFDYQTVKFDFLGYSFQPRTGKSKKAGKLFRGFDGAICISSKKRIADKMEELNIVGLTHKSIVGVAQVLNPYICG